MNLASTLHRGAMGLWLLKHPQARDRRSISPERTQDKLGWLREYAVEVARWAARQRVIGVGVTFVNEQGLFRGAANRFQELVAAELTCEASRDVAARLTAFLRESEEQLREGERLPLSTEEILESSFALYKQTVGAPTRKGRLHGTARHLRRAAPRRRRPCGKRLPVSR